MSQTLQYILVSLAVAFAVAWTVRAIVRGVRRTRDRHPACAGCPLAATCQQPTKKCERKVAQSKTMQ